MLVSREAFIKEQEEKSKLLGKKLVLAHHQSKKTIIGKVVNQDKYGIEIQPIYNDNTIYLYYGAYHILEWID